ncbi:DUF2933 domain-containing protein [Spongiactinospora sp. TRM90649]|uniref:DUF2933 domain-containing protein n=1 Tax=Spongiactinospora sp. TRM90649 TaxID=3031114 RepID=UPI0023F9C11B|nr:DUF2933 domain-containing protein [Spongiactinospora sp. TRM90649]MDF5755208.1 DUF2933 domain-containing protein [Spongiactinospora sp. TRM90649]
MIRQHLVPAGVAAVVALVALAAGTSASTVLLVRAGLACPLVMLMMMRGLGGHDTTGRRGVDHEDQDGGGDRGVRIGVS